MLTCLGPKVRQIMLRHRKIVGSCWLLCEDAHLVDEGGDELAPPDVEYLYRLTGSS